MRGPSVSLVEFDFVSRARADLPEAALRRLARDISARNERRGLTGEIRYEGGRFQQVIEGPADMILMLASSILSDARHGGIQVLGFRAIGARRFSDWRVHGINPSATFCALRMSDPVDATRPAAARAGRAWPIALVESVDRRA